MGIKRKKHHHQDKNRHWKGDISQVQYEAKDDYFGPFPVSSWPLEIDPFAHNVCIGKSGSGKSALVKKIALAVAKSGTPIYIVDRQRDWAGPSANIDTTGLTKIQQPVQVYNADEGTMQQVEEMREKGHNVFCWQPHPSVEMPFYPPKTGIKGKMDAPCVVKLLLAYLLDNSKNAMIIVEEATDYQTKHTIMREYEAILQQKRKDRLGCWTIAQRPQNLHTDTLSQPPFMEVFGVRWATDANYLEDFLGKERGRALRNPSFLKNHMFFFSSERDPIIKLYGGIDIKGVLKW